MCVYFVKQNVRFVTQKAFCWKFFIPCNNAVPNANTINTTVGEKEESQHR